MPALNGLWTRICEDLRLPSRQTHRNVLKEDENE